MYTCITKTQLYVQKSIKHLYVYLSYKTVIHISMKIGLFQDPLDTAH